MIFGSFKAIAALVLLSVLVACPSSPPDTTAPSILSMMSPSTTPHFILTPPRRLLGLILLTGWLSCIGVTL